MLSYVETQLFTSQAQAITLRHIVVTYIPGMMGSGVVQYIGILP